MNQQPIGKTGLKEALSYDTDDPEAERVYRPG